MTDISSKFPPLWHKGFLKRKAECEKERRKILMEVDSALGELGKQYQWEEAYIFGSLTSITQFGPSSDVDIALKGLNKLDLYKFVGDISLILNRRVDVMRLEECTFSKSIIDRGIKWMKKNK